MAQSISERDPAPKRARRMCHFDSQLLEEFPGIGNSSKGEYSLNTGIDIQNERHIKVK